MFSASLVVCCAIVVGDPPKTPTVDQVRKALRQNIERIQNRRVKYVIVYTNGEPSAEFPPVDSPDRSEIERIISADGRWKEKSTSFRSGMVVKTKEAAFDGARSTTLEGTPSQELGFRALIGTNRHGRENGHIDNLWDGLDKSLGIRSTLTWAPNDKPFLLLNPRLDDRSTHRATYNLDPARNYWPRELHLETQNEKGDWQTQGRDRVIDYVEGSQRLYPKRMTSWNLNGNDPSHGSFTLYLSVTSVEFPERFDDAAFRVAIPDGAKVRDDTTAREWVQGAAEIPHDSPPKARIIEDLSSVNLDDWPLYGGFVAVVVAIVLAFWYSVTRNRKTPPKPE